MQRNTVSDELEALLPLDGVAILVIEDDLETLALFDLFLTHLGAKVLTAVNVKTALQAVAECQPDILISDLQLPDGSGYELLDTVRNLQADSCKFIPAIAMSGYSTRLSEPAYNRGAVAWGFQKFLSKPFNIDELIGAIVNFTKNTSQATYPYCWI
ncbi:MAG: response regulator [Trichocoleus desertorum ATA4-8-CV12]|jgi:CheY-like chemotaxis protein|nr:response regulator [Trichocoleus desertorum ATA4-8-CV12]